jgi:hypothetical protein
MYTLQKIAASRKRFCSYRIFYGSEKVGHPRIQQGAAIPRGSCRQIWK